MGSAGEPASHPRVRATRGGDLYIESGVREDPDWGFARNLQVLLKDGLLEFSASVFDVQFATPRGILHGPNRDYHWQGLLVGPLDGRIYRALDGLHYAPLEGGPIYPRSVRVWRARAQYLYSDRGGGTYSVEFALRQGGGVGRLSVRASRPTLFVPLLDLRDAESPSAPDYRGVEVDASGPRASASITSGSAPFPLRLRWSGGSAPLGIWTDWVYKLGDGFRRLEGGSVRFAPSSRAVYAPLALESSDGRLDVEVPLPPALTRARAARCGPGIEGRLRDLAGSLDAPPGVAEAIALRISRLASFGIPGGAAYYPEAGAMWFRRPWSRDIVEGLRWNLKTYLALGCGDWLSAVILELLRSAMEGGGLRVLPGSREYASDAFPQLLNVAVSAALATGSSGLLAAASRAAEAAASALRRGFSGCVLGDGLVLCPASSSWIDVVLREGGGRWPSRLPRDWMGSSDPSGLYALVEVNALYIESYGALASALRAAGEAVPAGAAGLLEELSGGYGERFRAPGRLPPLTIDPSTGRSDWTAGSPAVEAMAVLRGTLHTIEDLSGAWAQVEPLIWRRRMVVLGDGEAPFGIAARDVERVPYLGDAEYHGYVLWPRDTPYLMEYMRSLSMDVDGILLNNLDHMLAEGALGYSSELFSAPLGGNPSPSGASGNPVPVKNPAQYWSHWCDPYLERYWRGTRERRGEAQGPPPRHAPDGRGGGGERRGPGVGGQAFAGRRAPRGPRARGAGREAGLPVEVRRQALPHAAGRDIGDLDLELGHAPEADNDILGASRARRGPGGGRGPARPRGRGAPPRLGLRRAPAGDPLPGGDNGEGQHQHGLGGAGVDGGLRPRDLRAHGRRPGPLRDLGGRGVRVGGVHPGVRREAVAGRPADLLGGRLLPGRRGPAVRRDQGPRDEVRSRVGPGRRALPPGAHEGEVRARGPPGQDPAGRVPGGDGLRAGRLPGGWAQVRVLHLSWEYPPRIVGGLSRHVYGLSRALAAMGAEVVVITLESPGVPDSEVSGNLEVVRVRASGYPSPDFPAWVHQFNLRMVEAALDAGDFDIVHAHDWLSASAGIALKHALRRPLISTIHSTECGRRGGIRDELQRHIAEMEWWLAYESWRVIACSRYMMRELGGCLGVPADKVDVIPNGFTPLAQPGADRASIRRRYAADGERMVLFVGRMVHEKGVSVLVDAALELLRRRWDLKFVLAGDGPLRPVLQRRVEEAGLARKFYFLGFVSDEELAELYAAADVAAFPSTYEPFGIVALEAMSMGRPVVVSDVGGFSEVVEHGVSGLKVPCCDPGALASAISWLVDHPEEASRMGAEGARIARERYSWDALAGRTMETYRRVLAEYERSGWRARTCARARPGGAGPARRGTGTL
ncbi:MAG: glycosyltransferase family 4 protein [Nitrososphaeria archaeon]